MQWKSNVNGHKIVLTELPETGGVEELLLYCNSCMVDIASFDPVGYHKYRHAFYAAWEKAKAHSKETRV